MADAQAVPGPGTVGMRARPSPISGIGGRLSLSRNGQLTVTQQHFVFEGTQSIVRGSVVLFHEAVYAAMALPCLGGLLRIRQSGMPTEPLMVPDSDGVCRPCR